jgi:hypothetical protein
MSDDRNTTSKATRTGCAASAPITQHNMSTKRNTRTTTTRTSTAKAAANKAAFLNAAKGGLTPAEEAAAFKAEIAALKAALATALAAAPAVAAAPAPAPAPAPAAPAPAVVAPAPAAKALPAEVAALVGRTIRVRYQTLDPAKRPLVYTMAVETAWAAKGGHYVKGPVTERDGAERWLRLDQVVEWISRG